MDIELATSNKESKDTSQRVRRNMMYKAKETQESQYPDLYKTVRELTQKTGLPAPKIYVMDTPMPNAFATGRNPSHAAVAVTTGIMNLLTGKELAGVIAHELSHIKNRDTLIQVVAATIAGAIFTLSNMARWAMMFGGLGGRDREENNGNGLALLAVMIIAPIAAMIIQMAISRSREYMADESGARISSDPLALASALRKLDNGVKNTRGYQQPSPATAHMFIVNPLTGKNILSLFSTHPPIDERIKRLESLVIKIREDKYKTLI